MLLSQLIFSTLMAPSLRAISRAGNVNKHSLGRSVPPGGQFMNQIKHLILLPIEFYLCYGTLATVFGICGIGRIVFVYKLWAYSLKL